MIAPRRMSMTAGMLIAGLALAGCASTTDPGTAPAPSTSEATEPDDESPSPSVSPAGEPPQVEPMCAADEPKCDDTIDVPSELAPSEGLAETCLEGATECADIPGASRPGPPGEALSVEPRDDLVEVRAVPWEDVVPVDDDQMTLRVTWFGGTEGCYGLDHVEVEETAEVVTITVFTGIDPEVQICTQEAVLKSFEVQLDVELGPRSILDGAA